MNDQPLDGPGADLDEEGLEVGADPVSDSRLAQLWEKWRPKCKVVAAMVTGGIMYGLGALGIDIGPVLQDLGEIVGVDIPDQKAGAVLAGMGIAFYVMPEDFCRR